MSLHNAIKWSTQEFASLPWRRHRSLYGTLVSEIMLQQTTVATVIKHFERFMNHFPDLESLAMSNEDELIRQWKGLGYYRRARNLHRAARVFSHQWEGKIPLTLDILKTIPGIGDYTSAALCAIGGNLPALAIDANIERVYSRLFALDESKGPSLHKAIKNHFILHVQPTIEGQFRHFNEALMDIGRVYCRANAVFCHLCPMQSQCLSFQRGCPLDYPMEKKSRGELSPATLPKKHEIHLIRFKVMKKIQGQFCELVYQKNEKQWLHGQHEWPSFVVSTTDSQLIQYPPINDAMKKFIQNHKPIQKIQTTITHYKITNEFFIIEPRLAQKLLGELGKNYSYLPVGNYNLSTACLKFRENAQFF